MSARRAAGELENEVLAALWSAARPLSARDVGEAISSELAYNTVQTILARLYGKGLVERFRYGRAHRYAPINDPEELTALKMRELLDAGADRQVVLRQFISELRPADQQILRDLLDTARRRTNPRRRGETS